MPKTEQQSIKRLSGANDPRRRTGGIDWAVSFPSECIVIPPFCGASENGVSLVQKRTIAIVDKISGK